MLKHTKVSRIFILSAFLCPLLSNADSIGLTYHHNPIHPGCIRELKTEPSGDEVVAAINLSKPSIRSCRDSNRYWMKTQVREMAGKMLAYETLATLNKQKEKPQEWFGYRDLGDVGNSIHYLALCEDSNEGSLGRTCQGLFVKITSDSFLTTENKKSSIHSVDRLVAVGVSGQILSLSEAKKAVELLLKRSPSSSTCTVGTSKGCHTGEICMNSTVGGQCNPIPDRFPIQLSVPFAKTEKIVCTHSSGEGSHSWPNAFYAIDLATPYDSPAATIYAAADGKVFIFQGDDGLPCAEPKGTTSNAIADTCGKSWGNNVRILHSNGFFSFYVHLDKVLVNTGDLVKKGQVIGIEGWTGAAGHRHLHFSVQKLPGNNQQDWESRMSWAGTSVPFSFETIQNGNTVSISTDKISCPHQNISQVPTDQQPTFQGVF